MKKSILLLGVVFLMAIAFNSCQDDPVLQPVNDGIPVVTPKSKAFITLIQLNDFPMTDPGGNTWDIVDSAAFDTLGSPDIFYNITTPGPSPAVLWSQNSHFSNTGDTDTIPFYLLNEFEVVPFGSSIDVNLYDYELPDSTLMGNLNFTIGPFPDPLNPYPAYVTSQQNGFNLTIGIRWEE